MNTPKAVREIEFGDEFNPEVVRKVKYNSKMCTRNRYYNILSGRKLAIIFNHTEFQFDRCDSLADNGENVKRLQACFDVIEFEVKTYNDESADNILDVMKCLAAIENEISCLIVVVMTHGSEKHLEAHDRKYETSILWKTLEGKMIGIPKLFIIDACRGSKEDKGIEVSDFAVSTNPNEIDRFKLPTMADYLFMYSTYDDHVAFTSENGSYFISCLCIEIMLNYRFYDALQILTFVSQNVAVNLNFKPTADTTYSDTLKAMPQIVSMLTKLLRFDVEPNKNTK